MAQHSIDPIPALHNSQSSHCAVDHPDRNDRRLTCPAWVISLRLAAKQIGGEHLICLLCTHSTSKTLGIDFLDNYALATMANMVFISDLISLLEVA